MRNINIKWQKNFGLIVLILSLVTVTWIAALTYTNRNITNANRFFFFAIQNHLWLMFILIIIAAAVGFSLSSMLYGQVRKKEEHTKSTLETVLLFLGDEEKDIINYLVEKKGSATQADISRLPKMNRVKAFRSLQKMKDKKLIDIAAYGKLRKVRLKDNILSTLLEGT